MELLAYNARLVFSVSVSINDSHRNARNYRIDSQTPVYLDMCILNAVHKIQTKYVKINIMHALGKN